MGKYRQQDINVFVNVLKSKGWKVRAEGELLYVENPKKTDDKRIEIDLGSLYPEEHYGDRKKMYMTMISSKLEMKCDVPDAHIFLEGLSGAELPFKPRKVDATYTPEDLLAHKYEFSTSVPIGDMVKTDISLYKELIKISHSLREGSSETPKAGVHIYPGGEDNETFVRKDGTLFPIYISEELQIPVRISVTGLGENTNSFEEAVLRGLPISDNWYVESWQPSPRGQIYNSVSVSKGADTSTTSIKGYHDIVPEDSLGDVTHAYLTTLDEILGRIHHKEES